MTGAYRGGTESVRQGVARPCCRARGLPALTGFLGVASTAPTLSASRVQGAPAAASERYNPRCRLAAAACL